MVPRSGGGGFHGRSTLLRALPKGPRTRASRRTSSRTLLAMLAPMTNGRKTLSACLVLALGAVVGIASSVTDSVPYYGAVDLTPLGAATQLVTGVVNSFVVWFGVPFMLGHLLCRSWKQSAVAGGGFMVAAILSYFAHGSLNAAGPDVGAVSVMSTLLEWLTIAVVGGMIGGVAGFLARSRPSVLLVLALVTIAELARRGNFSWQSPISAGENIVFIVGAVGIVVYAVIATRKRRSVARRSDS